MNGEQEFAQLIKSAEDEITALKTAHRRPLGALDFDTKTETIDLNLEYSYGAYSVTFFLDVTIKTPDVTPPIVQTGWDIPAGFSRMDLFDCSVSDDYTVWSYRLNLLSATQSTASFKASAVSSVPIVSIQARVQS